MLKFRPSFPYILILLLSVTITFNFKSSSRIAKPWPRHTIDASSNGADGVKFGDFDGDRKLDIVTGWEEGGITRLYIQPEQSNLKALWPSIKVGNSPDVEDAVFIDLNSDGLLDVLSCAEGKTQKIFLHLAPSKESLKSENWTTEVLPASDGRMKWMYAQPLQLDEKNGIDIIAGGKGDQGAIGWFQAPRNPESLTNWKWYKISDMGWIMSLILRDMDNDGDMDIVVTDRYNELRGCRWLENPGALRKQKKLWKNHFIGAQDAEVMFMTLADIDGDGVEEAIVSERERETIRIYKRQGKIGDKWDEKIIQLPDAIGRAKSVEVGDIDNDGVKDLVVSTNTGGAKKHGLIWINGLMLRESIEVAEFETISGVHNAKYDKVELIDLDEDGDLDILICEENYGENSEGLGIIWYENTLGNH